MFSSDLALALRPRKLSPCTGMVWESGTLPAPDRVRGIPQFWQWVCDRSGGDGAFALCGDFLLGAEPVIEVVTLFPAACLVEFVRALADLDFKFLGFARYRCGWFLRRIFGHGEHSFAARDLFEISQNITLAC